MKKRKETNDCLSKPTNSILSIIFFLYINSSFRYPTQSFRSALFNLNALCINAFFFENFKIKTLKKWGC